MNYRETLIYLFEKLPMYQRKGKSAIKKDLKNIQALCSFLDFPSQSYPIIHVAGTNGKGTVSHMIAAIFQTLGMKVGLYTSPHYIDFRERIKVDGELIAEEDVVSFVQLIEPAIKRIEPSFFEISVAMAFDYFKDQQVDLAVIETGLGGRLDSTNIVDSEISVITNISLDHQDLLGHTMYQIAGEKACIMKQNKPAVIGRFQVECDHVFFKMAKKMNSKLTFADQQWKSDYNDIININTSERLRLHESFDPFFLENAKTSVEASRVFAESQNLPLDSASLENGINNFRAISNYIGRWQVLSERPLILTDSAHNEDALRKVLRHILALNKNIHFVLGFVKDKDLDPILSMLPNDHDYYFVQPGIPRALPIDLLKQNAMTFLEGCYFYDTVEEGISAAYSKLGIDDIMYIGGSSFVVADALACINQVVNPKALKSA